MSTGPNTGNGRSWYDGDGLRVRQRTFAATNPSIVDDDYTWDAGAGLPVVLQDKRTPEGGVAATMTYLYGLGLISATSGAGVTSYYLADGLGSTTQLTDSAGASTDSYSYDVFGAPRSATGTTANDFRYTGQQNDRNANRGLCFLRARSYDPALGRFLQKDPLPLANRYAYAGNNAANLTDPSGLCGVTSFGGLADCGKQVAASAGRAAENSVCQLGYVASCALVNAAKIPFVRSHAGYVDLNATACFYVCLTGGAQLSLADGLHFYAGGGVGYGAGLSATWAPGQGISTGWNCGAQASYGLYSAQAGNGGINLDKEGKVGGTAFGEIGVGLGAAYSSTCIYIR